VLDLELEFALRAKRPLANDTAARIFNVGLTGTIKGFAWTMKLPEPFKVAEGDRVELALRNQSVVAHPMHLHGHHFQVIAIDGTRLRGAVRDTAHIPPGQSLTAAFDAKNPGQWAFHCHHLHHMAAGMMIRLSYQA
jgi:FtsP/CotA-like multicopper oxidase with cupredoxin domain